MTIIISLIIHQNVYHTDLCFASEVERKENTTSILAFYNDVTYSNVSDSDACLDMCKKDIELPCRSVDFNTITRLCSIKIYKFSCARLLVAGSKVYSY